MTRQSSVGRLSIRRIALCALVGVAGCDGATGTEPKGDPVSIAFDPCTALSQLPTWLAFQDGSGPWTGVTKTNEKFSFTLTSGKGGVALYTQYGGLVVVYGTSSELNQYLSGCTGSLRTINGFLRNTQAGEDLSVFIGQQYAFPNNGVTVESLFAMDDVSPAANTVVALRSRQVETATTFQLIPESLLIFRGVTGESAGILDFNSTAAGRVESRTVTVDNLAGEQAVGVFNTLVIPDNYWTPQGSILGHLETEALVSYYELAGPAPSVPAVSAPYYPVSRARLINGEEAVLTVIALKTAGSVNDYRFAALKYAGPGFVTDIGILLASTLGPVFVTGTAHPSARYVIQPEYDGTWEFSVGRVEAIMTRGYAAGASEVVLAIPDLASASGFSSSWLPPVGQSTTWQFAASKGGLPVFSGAAGTYQGAYRRTSGFVP